jgi:hypothetical protein
MSKCRLPFPPKPNRNNGAPIRAHEERPDSEDCKGCVQDHIMGPYTKLKIAGEKVERPPIWVMRQGMELRMKRGTTTLTLYSRPLFARVSRGEREPRLLRMLSQPGDCLDAHTPAHRTI